MLPINFFDGADIESFPVSKWVAEDNPLNDLEWLAASESACGQKEGTETEQDQG